MKRRTDLVGVLALGALALACSSDGGTPPPPSVDTTTQRAPGQAMREEVVRVSAIVTGPAREVRSPDSPVW